VFFFSFLKRDINKNLLLLGSLSPLIYSTNLSNEIYLFDINTYTWTTTFGTSLSNSTTVTNSSSTLSTSIGIIVGVTIAIIILLSIVGFLIYYYYHKKRKFENVYPTAGSTNDGYRLDNAKM